MFDCLSLGPLFRQLFIDSSISSGFKFPASKQSKRHNYLSHKDWINVQVGIEFRFFQKTILATTTIFTEKNLRKKN